MRNNGIIIQNGKDVSIHSRSNDNLGYIEKYQPFRWHIEHYSRQAKTSEILALQALEHPQNMAKKHSDFGVHCIKKNCTAR